MAWRQILDHSCAAFIFEPEQCTCQVIPCRAKSKGVKGSACRATPWPQPQPLSHVRDIFGRAASQQARNKQAVTDDWAAHKRRAAPLTSVVHSQPLFLYYQTHRPSKCGAGSDQSGLACVLPHFFCFAQRSAVGPGTGLINGGICNNCILVFKHFTVSPCGSKEPSIPARPCAAASTPPFAPLAALVPRPGSAACAPRRVQTP
eukprot:358660-Chlamydomonas_euryale.AAC.4